jgi:hypothetical protein
MECPNCKLINPPGSLQCDCGYAFLTGTISAPNNPPDAGSVGRGVGLGLLLHLLQIVIVPGTTLLAGAFYPRDKEPLAAGLLFSAYAWSLTQFLYLGPAAWMAFRRGQRETAKGLLIVGAIGILINGGCDALILRPAR